MPYLYGEITKTGIPILKIPIREEVASLLKTLVEEAKGKSTDENNPDKYLFNTYEGKIKDFLTASLLLHQQCRISSTEKTSSMEMEKYIISELILCVIPGLWNTQNRECRLELFSRYWGTAVFR